MESNPYAAPSAVVTEVVEEQLASRFVRLVAVIVDAILMGLILGPLMMWSGYLERVAAGEISMIAYMVSYMFVSVLVFLLVQGWPLATSAQTWGKMLLGIRIANMDGSKASFRTILLLRYAPITAVSMVPLIGAILGLVNILMIFRGDRRCGHDFTARTQVLKV